MSATADEGCVKCHFNLCVVIFPLHVFVNDAQYSSSLTNAVGHELKSVRAKKHLGLSIYMTHQHGEAEGLGGDSRREPVHCTVMLLLPESTRRSKGQLTPLSSANCVVLFSLSLISFEVDSTSASSISLSDNPAFLPACKKEQQKHCDTTKWCFLIFSTTTEWIRWYLRQ